jgi:alcohol dehydrogenase
MFDLQNSFEFTLKNTVRFGIGLSKNLSFIIKEFGFQKVGFIIDKNLYDNVDFLRDIISDCEKKCELVIVHQYNQKFEPTYQFLDELVKEFTRHGKPRIDCMIGIGGGSAMDSAKGIAVLCKNQGPAKNYKGFPQNINKPLPYIAVPSTAGTGSELVYNASFIDHQAKVKMGINDAVSSGCDALVHALESFVSVKANHITRIFSKQAFELIINTLPVLIYDLKNLQLWAKMQWGAYLAMVGLSNTSSGPAGALSYCLGTNFNVPHGIAGAAFIGKITRLNHELGYYGYSELFPHINHFDSNITDQKIQSEIVVKVIEDFLDALEIPHDLTGFGVSPEDYSLLYNFATETVAGAFDFNPIKYDNDTISKLIKEMLRIGG